MREQLFQYQKSAGPVQPLSGEAQVPMDWNLAQSQPTIMPRRLPLHQMIQNRLDAPAQETPIFLDWHEPQSIPVHRPAQRMGGWRDLIWIPPSSTEPFDWAQTHVPPQTVDRRVSVAKHQQPPWIEPTAHIPGPVDLHGTIDVISGVNHGGQLDIQPAFKPTVIVGQSVVNPAELEWPPVLKGVITAQSSITANLVTDPRFSGEITAVSLVEAPYVAIDVFMESQDARGRSTSDAKMGVIWGLVGEITAVSTWGALTIHATRMYAQVDEVATVEGTLKVDWAIRGTTQGTTTVDAKLDVGPGLRALVACQSSVAAVNVVDREFKVVVEEVSGLIAFMAMTREIAASVGAISVCSAVMQRTLGVAGTSGGISSTSGVISIDAALKAVVTVEATVSATIGAFRNLHTTVICISSASGHLITHPRLVPEVTASTSSAIGSLDRAVNYRVLVACVSQMTGHMHVDKTLAGNVGP